MGNSLIKVTAILSMTKPDRFLANILQLRQLRTANFCQDHNKYKNLSGVYSKMRIAVKVKGNALNLNIKIGIMTLLTPNLAIVILETFRILARRGYSGGNVQI